MIHDDDTWSWSMKNLENRTIWELATSNEIYYHSNLILDWTFFVLFCRFPASGARFWWFFDFLTKKWQKAYKWTQEEYGYTKSCNQKSSRYDKAYRQSVPVRRPGTGYRYGTSPQDRLCILLHMASILMKLLILALWGKLRKRENQWKWLIWSLPSA